MLISQNLHSLSEQTLDPLPQHIQSLVVSRGLDMRSFIPALLISCTSFSKALEYIFHLIPFYISQNRSGNSCIFKSHPFIHSDFPIHAGEDRFLSPPFLALWQDNASSIPWQAPVRDVPEELPGQEAYCSCHSA